MGAALRATGVAGIAMFALSSCGAERSVTREYLDPQTAVTVRAVGAPAIYAHDVPELAANVRDYLSVGAVELNNMGGRSYYLAVIAWSTVDRKRIGAEPPVSTGPLRLALGKAQREFAPTTREPRSIGVGLPLFRPTTGFVGETWYAVKVADLRELATEAPATLDLIGPEGPVSYALWREATTALADFVRDIPENIAPTNKRAR